MPIPNNDDEDIQPTADLGVPWTIAPYSSWLDYNCWIEVQLDAGMVLHKQLPQQAADVDTLARVALNGFVFSGDPDANPGILGGVNLQTSNTQADVIQRMATSTYRFIMRGYGRRAGYQIPIPGLQGVGGNVAVPEGVQRSYNKIVGNMSGVPIWMAEWELHYIISGPLAAGTFFAPVPPNMAVRIRGDTELPLLTQIPYAPVDDNATTSTLKTF